MLEIELHQTIDIYNGILSESINPLPPYVPPQNSRYSDISNQRLIRFIATNGKIYQGDAILAPGVTDISQSKTAKVITGDPFNEHKVTDEIVQVKTLLCPLQPERIGTVRCLGLNYAQHAIESNMPLPQYPVVFFKPRTSIAGPRDDIPVPEMAQQSETLDYECELVIVIGREAKDVSEDEALDYVLGYAVGDDVSHREWQLKLGGGQWSLGKGFDGWAPMGPGIVSSRVIKDPNSLRIWTKVNGELVQESNTADMIFNVKQAVSFLSKGSTLLPGDVIFTGT